MSDDPSAFDLQLREDAEQLFATLCEGEGEHTEALDVALITAAFRHVLSWAAAAALDAAPRSSDLLTYMTTTDPVARDAAFLRTYAERVRNGTAATWEIPSTVAGTIEAIAERMTRRLAADGGAVADGKK